MRTVPTRAALLLLYLCMTALAVAGWTSPAAAQGVKVALTPASRSVAPGDTFSVDLTVTRAGSAFNGYEAVIGFDPARLTFLQASPLSLQEGSLMTGACGSTFHRFTAGTNTLSIEHSLLCNGVSLTGPGQLYHLTFVAGATQGTTPLTFQTGLQFYNAGLFVNPDSSVDASVTIALYSITASAGAGGSISPPGTQVLHPGATQAYTITPDPHYHVTDVVVDGVSQGALAGYTFTNVQANHSIVASFALDTYTVTASGNAGGVVAPSGAVSVPWNGSQAFSITPNTGYHVVDVLVDGVSVGAATGYTFSNVAANHTLTATFAINTYTITASAGPNGGITPSGAVTVNYGANQGFTISPSPGAHVVDVLVDGVSVGAVGTYTFTGVTAPHTISATFAITVYTITASAGANGSISPSGTVNVNSGADQAFGITPSAHHHVTNVLVDAASVGTVTAYTFHNVTANHTISCTFGIDTLTVLATSGAYGHISPTGSVPVPYGSNKSFTLTPNANCHIVDLKLDGISLGSLGNYTLTNVIVNHTLEAVFDTGAVTAAGSTPVPSRLRVMAAPNPTRGPARVRLESPWAGAQSVEVFGATGRRVRVLQQGTFAAGIRWVAWDGQDESGTAVPSGSYWISLRAGGRTARATVLVLK